MKNSENLHKKSTFLNKFKPEQRTNAQLAKGNVNEELILTKAMKTKENWNKTATTLADKTNRPVESTVFK